MPEEKTDRPRLLSPAPIFRRHGGRAWPPRYSDPSGEYPYFPTEGERTNCGHAEMMGKSCPSREESQSAGVFPRMVNCANCTLHPENDEDVAERAEAKMREILGQEEA